MVYKKEKLYKLFEFIKSEKNFLTSDDSKNIIIASGNEYLKISTAFLYILPTAILVRFLRPPIEYGIIQIFLEDKSYDLPPAMGVPTFLFGDIATYVLESFVRTHCLCVLVGTCNIFIITTLYLCTQHNILAMKLENLKQKNDAVLNNLIKEHQELLEFTKILNEIYSPYFFANCLFSFINLSIMMFSLLASNFGVGNLLMEGPLVTAGMSQLFFNLYFGSRLKDAVSLIIHFYTN